MDCSNGLGSAQGRGELVGGLHRGSALEQLPVIVPSKYICRAFSLLTLSKELGIQAFWLKVAETMQSPHRWLPQREQ